MTLPTVTFGGTAATVVSATATQIVCTAPAHAAGAVGVVVTRPDGVQATLAGGYTYIGPPVPTSVDPGSGSEAGGTPIAILGTGFQSGATATIDGADVTDLVFVSSTELDGVTPAVSAGQADVVVHNPDGQSGTLVDGFTYTVDLPATNLIMDSLSNYGVFSDAGETTPAVDGDNVRAWLSRLSGGHLVSNASLFPTIHDNIFGTLPGVLVENGHYGMADGGASISGSVTVFMVVKSSANGFLCQVVKSPFLQRLHSSTGPGSGVTNFTGFAGNSGGVYSGRNMLANWGSDNAVRLIRYEFDGTHAGHKLFIDGVEQSFTSGHSGDYAVPTAGSVGLHMGVESTTSSATSYYAAMVVYSPAPPDPAAVESALNAWIAAHV